MFPCLFQLMKNYLNDLKIFQLMIIPWILAMEKGEILSRGIEVIGAKICALMAHIRNGLCTKGHLDHPT